MKISRFIYFTIIFLFILSCSKDDDHINIENESFLELTFEGGDNNSSPTIAFLDDKYIHSGDYYDTNNNLKDTLLFKAVYIEEEMFNGSMRTKYDIYIDFTYIQSQNKIIDSWAYFNEFYHPNGASKGILVSTAYHALFSEGYPLKISDIKISNNYVTGNFEGTMYSNPSGPNTPYVRKMDITNGTFKMKLEN